MTPKSGEITDKYSIMILIGISWWSAAHSFKSQINNLVLEADIALCLKEKLADSGKQSLNFLFVEATQSEATVLKY